MTEQQSNASPLARGLTRKLTKQKTNILSTSIASKQTIASQSKMSISKLGGGLDSKSRLQAKLAEA
jgi:hypothetical protein